MPEVINLDKYRYLFDIENYADEENVHFYSNLNENIIGEPHLIPISIFVRIHFIGKAYNLHYIPLFDPDMELSKPQISTLIDELNLIASNVEDGVIRYFISPLIELLKGILYSHKEYSLKIIGV